jgi:transcriptional regulator with XRE-family HTH domain
MAKKQTAREVVTEGIGEFIRAQRRLARLSLRQLAELAKVSNAYLSQIERGVYKPSAKVLKSLSEALHVSAETLYARAGLLEEHPDSDIHPSVEEAIRLDPRLNTEQKETLIRVYRGFAGPDTR